MTKKMIVSTKLLRNLGEKLRIVERSKLYLEKELSIVKSKEAILKEKIRKEKKAISLVNKARKLR